jgi:hypothetical protein
MAVHHTEENKSEKLDKKLQSHLLKEVNINSIQQDKAKLWSKESK